MSAPAGEKGVGPAGGNLSGAPSVAELFDLRGKVALVTGGGMGIGAAIALRLAGQGASVMVADVNLEAAQGVIDRVRALGARGEVLRADAGSPTDPDRAVAETVRSLGDLHLLVNNAGIFPFSSAADTPVDLWDRVLAINLRGPFLFARASARAMSARGHGGSIVNIASIDAFRASGNLAHYDASKAGLAMLTRSLALEWGAQGIRVNAVAPGGINTPGAQAGSAGILKSTGIDPEALMRNFLQRIPLRRMGEPDDIARAVLFLAAPASEYITGSVIVVDGGYLLG